MEIELTRRSAKQVYGGNGGSYHSWSPDEFPMLSRGNVGAAKLSLEKNGFALPYYLDSSKEDTELVVLFLGDTLKAHKAGEFTHFFLAGSDGIFTSFSTEFVGRAWDLDENTVKTLVGNQSGKGIVQLKEGFKLPEPMEEHRKGMALNCEKAPLDVNTKNDGKNSYFEHQKLPLVGEVGLGGDLVRLDGSANVLSWISCDYALQVTYVFMDELSARKSWKTP